MKIGCVILAAGASRRFGENKLLSLIGGKPLYEYAFDSAPRVDGGVCVVSGCGEILRAARERGFTPVRNSQPELGASLSVRLGLGAMSNCEGLMFSVADQPFLKKETVTALASFFLERPEDIAALGYGERRGNPCVFPREFFPELSALSGDVGGSRIISAHPHRLRLMQVEERELWDIDTREALNKLQEV